MNEKEEKVIMREVLKDVDLDRYPFDNFWFWEGYTKANEKIKKAIEELDDYGMETVRTFKRELLTKIKEMGE